MIRTDVLIMLFLALGTSEIRASDLARRPSLAGDVVGRVTDPKGDGLGGAVVAIEGTRFGGTTRSDGTYRIAGVPDGQYSIRVRRIGHKPTSKELTVAGAAVTVDFVLQFVPTQLEEVVVTGNLSRTEARAVPAAVSIVTADEIEARGITKVDEIFKTIPGVSVLSEGQWNHYATVTIRGGNSIGYSSTAKVLVDGVEVAQDYAINDIDPANIERIEVFRGPQASTIYGSSASGGLIQIITKKGEYTTRKAPGLEAMVSAGYIETRNKYGNGAARTENTLALVGGGKEFSYRIGGGFSKQGNWTKNGFESSPNLFGHVRLNQGPLLLEANVRYVTRNFGWLYNPDFEVIAPSVFTGLNITEEIDISRTQSYSLHAVYQAAKNWTHEVSAGFDQTAFDWWSTLPKDTLGTQYISLYSTAQPSVKYHMGWDQKFGARVASALTLGADYSGNRGSGYYWEGVGNPSAGSIPSEGATYAYYSYLNSTAFYGQEVLGIADKLHFTFGLRADRQRATNTPVDYAWSPRAGVAYARTFGQVSAKLRASYGSVPSPIPAYALQEQNYPGDPGTIYHANPNIRPPRLSGADVGFELYFGRRASLVATYYNQRPKDQIDFVTTYADSANNLVGTFQNIGEIHNQGWEFEGRLYFERLTLIGTYSPVNGKITKLGPDYTGALVVGDKLINVPDWTASITASLNLPKTSILLTAAPTGKHLNYNYTKLYTDYEAGTYDPANDRALYIINYPGFTKFSLSVSQEISRRLQAFLSVQDLFNSGAIETYDYTITKSRVSKVGVRIRP